MGRVMSDRALGRRSTGALGVALALALVVGLAPASSGNAVLAAAGRAGLAGDAAAPTLAATFETPRATARFGVALTFEQRVRVDEAPARVEILLDFPGALGPHVVEVPAPRPSGGAIDLRHVLDLADAHIVPNTSIGARWRLVAADGSTQTGPRTSVRYEDTRFAWRTRAGTTVRVHWYEGSNAFGDRALRIAEGAVAEISALLGVEEAEPIDFFVYAGQEPFYDALGPGTRENVGGQANAEIRTLFALIGPDAIDDPWVDIVIPHELSHLVFDTAVENPYHFPPRWLNEGVATYLSAGYAASDRREVAAAVRRDGLTPLDGLTGQFPTTRDEFFLAYAESVSAVDFLVATYGRDALVRLIRSYADGTTDDEAFRAALGVDTAGFDAAWRASLEANAPIEYGPQPAPRGPVPPGWDVPVIPGGGSPAPTASGDGPLPSPDPGPGDGGDAIGAASVAIILALLAVGAAILASRWRATRGRAS